MTEHVPAHSLCSSARMPSIGGNQTRAIAAFPQTLLSPLLPKRKLDQHAGFSVLSPDEIIRSPQLDDSPDPRYLPARTDVPHHLNSAVFTWVCPASGLLTLTNRNAINLPFLAEVQQRDGQLVPPIDQSIATRFFACSANQSLNMFIQAPSLAPLEILFFRDTETTH